MSISPLHDTEEPASSGDGRGEVRLSGISKSYGSFTALDGVSLAIAPGEFVSLLGPSGSGKSTLLMMVAGFEKPTHGEILVDRIRIDDQPAHKRGFGVVFQRYALFPHMTVAQNVAYPLLRRGMRGDVVAREVDRALELVDLGEFAARMPAQLSGGQQQRVALARALVFKPPLLLMDEPLGALDRKLRQQLQIEIKQIHRQIGSTIIFVTHDQEEALSMADRVAVLERGRLQQFGTPRQLYERPANAFVADFVGETSFVPVTVRRRGENVRLNVACLQAECVIDGSRVLTDSEHGHLAVRPESVRLLASAEGEAIVVECAYAGTTQVVLVEVHGVRLLARTQVTPGTPLLEPGQRVSINVDMAHAMVYPAA